MHVSCSLLRIVWMKWLIFIELTANIINHITLYRSHLWLRSNQTRSRTRERELERREDIRLVFKKIKLGLWDHICYLCLCKLSSPLAFEWLNQFYETWYVYHGTWAHLSGVLHKSLPSVCVSICIFAIPLLGIGCVNTFSRQRIHATVEELLFTSFSTRSFLRQRRFCGSVYLFRC
jgi:hypothetical protein